MMRMIALASRLGVLRLWESLFPERSLTPPSLPLSVHQAIAATRNAKSYRAMASDFASVPSTPESLRHSDAMGVLGDKPLVVITHGQKFPPPYDVLEIGWDEGQQRLADQSRDGELI